jgi:ribose transport system substrate-binding protein
MKRMIVAGLTAALAVGISTANAQDKQTLAFVVNGASDFWKLAEAGVR